MSRVKKANVLLYDLETAPNIAFTWGKYDQNVLGFLRERDILCFAYKWLGEKTVHSVSREGQRSDRQLVKKLHRLFEKADVVIAHNGDKFDQRRAQARFIKYDLLPPAYQSVDTLKVARKYFAFNSNSLDDLGAHLGLGRKRETGGTKLWIECMQGNSKAWAKMVRYNMQDVRLLERVYKRFRAWIENHPNLAALAGRPDGCPKCNSPAPLISKGWRQTRTRRYRRYLCRTCGSNSIGVKSEPIANKK